MSTGSMNRRVFLGSSAATAAGVASAATMAKKARAASANEKVVIGCMGIGGRGSYLTRKFAERSRKVGDCEVAYVCDVKADKLARGAKAVQAAQRKPAKAVKDFREILDDKDVDALVIATPDHWHALPVVWGAEAGKHSYVEKPASHSIWEGRQMVNASRKYKKVVQLGTQTRSCEYMRKCIDYIQSGAMGEVHMIKVYNMAKKRSSFQAHPDSDPPKGFDYEKWLGPAPMVPYNVDRVGRWNWWWDYSGGDIINDGVHQMDLANWLVASRSPSSVYCLGGEYACEDPLQAPDTQTVIYEFPKLTMTFELAMWTPTIHKTDMRVRDGDHFPEWRFNATRIEVYGTKEMMYIGRHGGGWQSFKPGTVESTVVKRRDGETVTEKHKVRGSVESSHFHGVQGNVWHQDNFIKCIQQGKWPNADIADGHKSTVLCHLGNISLRVGCKKLLWDGEAEQFTNSDEANALVKRTYREPWVIKQV